jgi:glycine cleavage system H protein
MAITSSMVEILGEPYKILLLSAGIPLSLGDAFGTIEGYKMIADLLTPVSGVILETNSPLLIQRGGEMITPINDDPYNSGWLIVVQLNNPNDLKSLLTAQGYVNLLVASH